MDKSFYSGRHISIVTQLVAFLLVGACFVALPHLSFLRAHAAMSTDPTVGCGAGAVNTALGCIPFENKGFTAALLRFLAGTAGAISLVVMLMATIQIMTGGGNPEQVKKGKELFTGAITGLLFIIFSVVLMRIVASDVLQIPGFEQSANQGR